MIVHSLTALFFQGLLVLWTIELRPGLASKFLQAQFFLGSPELPFRFPKPKFLTQHSLTRIPLKLGLLKLKLLMLNWLAQKLPNDNLLKLNVLSVKLVKRYVLNLHLRKITLQNIKWQS